MKWLIYGGKGWIGGQVCSLIEKNGDDIIYALSRADNEEFVEKELLDVQPDRVVSLIGRTFGHGFNTIDYLEQKGKLIENLKDNLYGPFVLATLCAKHNIHFTYLGTGCIFNGYENGGYDEESKPDFFGSSYSSVKGITDRIMHFFDANVLNVRIRMPASDNNNKRNFIVKIMNYEKICSIPNSMTVLPELLPIMIDMAKNKVTGTVNLTNPGLITHNEVLQMVKDIINPDLKWENFDLADQDKILLAGRSNNLLNTDKLVKLYPNVLNVKESMRNVIVDLKKNMENN